MEYKSDRGFSSGRQDIRAMIAEVMILNHTDMESVVFDDGVPVIVRRFAESLLQGDVKEMSLILDQALGKPVERHMEIAQQPSAIEQLSLEEIKALLAMNSAGGEDNGEE